MDLSKNRLAIVDDDQDVLFSMHYFLKDYFDNITLYSHPKELMNSEESNDISVVLLDLNYHRARNDGDEGIEALEKIKNQFKSVEVIVMTAYAEISLAVEAVKKGAYDFIVKPWQNEKLLITIINAVQKVNMQVQLFNQEIELTSFDMELSPIIGDSHEMKEVRDIISKAANSSVNVLLKGESGVGKQLISKHIHFISNHVGHGYVVVDFSTIAEKDQHLILFGDSKTRGKWQLAEGGTLFLNRIEMITKSIQDQLLKLIYARKNELRIISSTEQKNLQGTLNEELIHKLSTLEIKILPLREHSEDIEDLFYYFLEELSEKYRKRVPKIADGLLNDLVHYSWPYNIRELKKAIERAILMDLDMIQTEDIILNAKKRKTNYSLGTLEELEKEHIRNVLKGNKGNILRSAIELGISRAALYRRIEKYQIEYETL